MYIYYGFLKKKNQPVFKSTASLTIGVVLETMELNMKTLSD